MWQGFGNLNPTYNFQVGYIYQYINTDGGNVYLSVSANTDAVYPSIITVMVSVWIQPTTLRLAFMSPYQY